jgi:hypothetical protein
MDSANDMFRINSFAMGTIDFGLVSRADWSLYRRVNTSGVLGKI